MLTAAGAPTIASEVAQDMTLNIGTLIHKQVADFLVGEGIPFMQEVKLTPWLPEGWAGTADWIFFDPRYQAFVLGDLKTIKGEGLKWVEEGGPKIEHVYQLSAYWYALREMGLDVVKGVGVLYLPKNDTADKQERIEPIIHEFDPVDEDELKALMAERWGATKAYLDEVESYKWQLWDEDKGEYQLGLYLSGPLAPPQERIQKYWWNGKQGVFDVKLVPHWSAQYCPFPNELCDCSEQGTEKIGHYAWQDGDLRSDAETGLLPDEWAYIPRKGYEEIEPTVTPTAAEFKRREPK